ncbi:RNA-directed DNA polymerase, eukaryota, reverse transcriptase zinc-binding domain protein [Tanacetum coccineum]|uniref:RNA-directed DNA polymerase, eukaryota, reverse transcriptase zinc-binding domain protein n=1 Tax=Tanacetum coccineum TaxID=301880 RepID=A0ABQ5ACY3_9ASTR
MPLPKILTLSLGPSDAVTKVCDAVSTNCIQILEALRVKLQSCPVSSHIESKSRVFPPNAIQVLKTQKETIKHIFWAYLHDLEEDVNVMKVHLSGQAILCLIKTVYKGTVNNNPWILIGDWNLSLNIEDHYGGSCKSDDMIKFQECLDKIEVEDLNCLGAHFTWIQSRLNPTNDILKKIDKVLGITMMSRKKKAFIFTNYIANKPEFKEIMEKEWNIDTNGCKLYRLEKKLKAMKNHMKELNWKQGNLFEKVTKWRENMKDTQKEVDKDPSNDALKKKNVANQFVKHFQEFLRKEVSVIEMEPNTIHITNKVSMEVATMMTRPMNDEEVKKALFDICDNKASGPVGFTSKFYKKEWNTVGKDVCEAVKDFFSTRNCLGK